MIFRTAETQDAACNAKQQISHFTLQDLFLSFSLADAKTEMCALHMKLFQTWRTTEYINTWQ